MKRLKAFAEGLTPAFGDAFRKAFPKAVQKSAPKSARPSANQEQEPEQEQDTIAGVCHFDNFWKQWPKHKRKTGKGKCRDLWKRKGLDAQGEHIAEVLSMLAVSEEWTKDDGQFIPAPLAWLNKGGYDCDVADLKQVTTHLEDRNTDPAWREQLPDWKEPADEQSA